MKRTRTTAVYRAKRARQIVKQRRTGAVTGTAPFDRTLARLGCRTYDDYLRSAHWVGFRSRFYAWFQAAHGRICCERCGRRTGLNLHHRTYARLGCERFDDIELLCRACHREEHGRS